MQRPVYPPPSLAPFRGRGPVLQEKIAPARGVHPPPLAPIRSQVQPAQAKSLATRIAPPPPRSASPPSRLKAAPPPAVPSPRSGRHPAQAKLPIAAHRPPPPPPIPAGGAAGTVQPFGLLLGAAAVAGAGWLYDRYVASDEQRLRLRRWTTRLPLLGDDVLADTIDNALIERDAGRITLGPTLGGGHGGGTTTRTPGGGGPPGARHHVVRMEGGLDRDLSTGYFMHELIHARVDNTYALNNAPGNAMIHVDNVADVVPGLYGYSDAIQHAIDTAQADPLLPRTLKTHCVVRLNYAGGNPTTEFQTVCADILFSLYRQGIPKRSAFYRLMRAYGQANTQSRG